MYSNVKHAYILTINGNLPVVNTCLQMLDYETNDFYFLCDKKWNGHIHINSNLRTLKRAHIRYLESKVINWGGYSQVSAILTLLKAVLDSGINYSYIHFLQGSDLPIKHNNDIIDFFERNKGKEFINIDMTKSGLLWADSCCKYRYYFSHNRFYRNNLIIKGLNIYIAKFQKLVGIRNNKNVDFYYGSALFSITHTFAKYLLSQQDKIYKLFKWSLAPDEKFIQTIIMNSPFKDNVYNKNSITSNSYLIDWSLREHNSPRVWRISDISQLMSQPDDVCFARKFMSNIDMDVVNELKNRILDE